jgi:hypothetical protein
MDTDWKSRVNYFEAVIFCSDWRTRDEIREKFGLENISSWHCFKWLSRCGSDFMMETHQGYTKRAYRLKSRESALKEARTELGLVEKLDNDSPNEI